MSRCVVCLSLVLCAGFGGLLAVELVPFAGEPIVGEAVQLTPEAVTLDGTTLAWADCDRLRLQGAADPVAADVVVLLADGSWLPGAGLHSDEADRLTLTTPLGEQTLALGDHLLGWGSPAWLDRASAEPAADIVVFRTEQGPTRLPGTVMGISDGQLEFEARDLGLLQKPLADVLGLRLRMPLRPAAEPLLLTELLPGFPLCAFTPAAGGLQLAAVDGPLAQLPTGWLLVDAARRVWIEDVPLIEEELVEEGAFGVVWEHRFGRNIDGSPLVLAGKRSEHGVVAHAKARLVWRLDGRFTRFRARLGIPDLLGREGDCIVRLATEQGVLHEVARLRGGDAPHRIDLDVSGAERLIWEIDFGQRYDIGDHVALADAWFLRPAE